MATRAGTATDKILSHLRALSAEAFNEMSASTYRKRTGHQVDNGLFNTAKTRARKELGHAKGARAKSEPGTRKRAAAAEPVPATLGRISILGTVSLEAYPQVPPAVLKQLAGEIVKVLMPAGSAVLLSDPFQLEIRGPA